MAKPQRLVEGTDYYMEEGKMVLKAEFLLRRGYCCNSGCRHCPYGTKPKPNVGVSILGVGNGESG